MRGTVSHLFLRTKQTGWGAWVLLNILLLHNYEEQSQPDEVGVHKFRANWSQNLIAAVLHQAQLPGIKYHAHLKRETRTGLWIQQSEECSFMDNMTGPDI